MAAPGRTHVEVYVFRRRAGRVEHLVLRRAKNRKLLPGVWQPVTGKIELLERATEAAIREVGEETGLTPVTLWCLETVTTYYDAARDRMMTLPLFAVEVGAKDRVKQSKEHDDFAWLPEAEAGKQYLWESQRRALAAVKAEVLRKGPLSQALKVATAPVPRNPRAPRRRG
jgi:dATP pyrophosphohydrolase